MSWTIVQNQPGQTYTIHNTTSGFIPILPSPSDSDKPILAAALALVLWADGVFAEVEVYRYTPVSPLHWQLRLSPSTPEFWKKVWRPETFSPCKPRIRQASEVVTIGFTLTEETSGTFDFHAELTKQGITVMYLPTDVEKLNWEATREARKRERAEWRRRQGDATRRLSKGR